MDKALIIFGFVIVISMISSPYVYFLFFYYKNNKKLDKKYEEIEEKIKSLKKQ
jgi:hypothetical protein